MNELINVTTATINHETVNAVNARELWKKLESKQRFADWIKDRLEGFTEGQDFTVHKIMKGEDGRFQPTEYIISLDVAKHIAMLEATNRGAKSASISSKSRRSSAGRHQKLFRRRR